MNIKRWTMVAGVVAGVAVGAGNRILGVGHRCFVYAEAALRLGGGRVGAWRRCSGG